MRECFVFGASGHAKVVLDIARRAAPPWSPVLFDDDAARQGREWFGARVAGGREELRRWGVPGAVGVVAIGHNGARAEVAVWLEGAGCGWISLVHPAASVAQACEIGAGTVVMAGAVINPDARIGRHAIVNTAAVVDHDCVIGDLVHLAPGVRLCGGVQVGAHTLVGAGAVVVPGVRIGARAIVGAGAVVLEDVPEGATIVGNPGRILAVEP